MKPPAQFYTYLHRQADTGEIFYVGKGRDRRAYKRTQRNPFWKSLADKHGFEVEIVAMFYRESDALVHEKLLINEYRLQGLRLANFTDGGEGTAGRKHSEAARIKIREAATGRVPSAEVREKLSAAGKARVMSDEHKRRLSEANRARFAKEEERRKVSEAQKGKVLSDEARTKISEAKKGQRVNVGRKHTEEARRNMSLSRIGRVFSPETRAKISAAVKAAKLLKKSGEVVT